LPMGKVSRKVRPILPGDSKEISGGSIGGGGDVDGGGQWMREPRPKEGWIRQKIVACQDMGAFTGREGRR